MFLFLPPVVGSNRFCSLRQASSEFFRELATMSFAYWLVRAVSAVRICCSTNSRFCVAVGRNSRLMSSVAMSVVCSAAHSNIISDSLITPAKNASVLFDHRWKSSSLPENSFGRPKPFTSMRLGVSFGTWAVARMSIACTASDIFIREAIWDRRVRSPCWNCDTTCSIVVVIGPLQEEVPHVLLLLFTVQQTSRSTKLVHRWALPARFHHATTNRTTTLESLHSPGADSHHERQPTLRNHDVRICTFLVIFAPKTS